MRSNGANTYDGCNIIEPNAQGRIFSMISAKPAQSRPDKRKIKLTSVHDQINEQKKFSWRTSAMWALRILATLYLITSVLDFAFWFAGAHGGEMHFDLAIAWVWLIYLSSLLAMLAVCLNRIFFSQAIWKWLWAGFLLQKAYELSAFWFFLPGEQSLTFFQAVSYLWIVSLPAIALTYLAFWRDKHSATPVAKAAANVSRPTRERRFLLLHPQPEDLLP